MESLNSLTQHIELWAEIQEDHVTAVKPLHTKWKDAVQTATAAATLEAEDTAATSKSKHRKKKKVVENVTAVVDWPLFLPSEVVGHVPHNLKLLDSELCLHEAEAFKCLATMCRQLLHHSHIYKFKNHHITGQLLNTCMNTTIKSMVANIDEAAA